MRNNIIVIGCVHHNTLGVVRALGEKGVSPQMYLILQTNKAHNIVASSKYISKGQYFYNENSEEIISIVKRLRDPLHKTVIISCADHLAYTLDKYYEELKQDFILPNIHHVGGGIFAAVNKPFQQKIASEVGMHLPKTCIFNKSQENSFNEWNFFPCILKPVNSVEGTKADIHICFDQNDLYKDIESLHCSNYMLQEYIDKTFEFQLIGLSIDGGNKLIIPGFTQIIRQPQNTNTGYLKYSPIEELDIEMHKIKDFIQKLGYSGLFSMEFLKDKKGTNYFMEINLRNDGNAYVVTKAGVNLPYLWYRYCCDGLFPLEEKQTFEKPVYFMPEFEDFINVIKLKVNPFSWLKQLHGVKACAIYNKNDMGPFWCGMSDFIKRIIRKIKKMLFGKKNN